MRRSDRQSYRGRPIASNTGAIRTVELWSAPALRVSEGLEQPVRMPLCQVEDRWVAHCRPIEPSRLTVARPCGELRFTPEPPTRALQGGHARHPGPRIRAGLGSRYSELPRSRSRQSGADVPVVAGRSCSLDGARRSDPGLDARTQTRCPADGGQGVRSPPTRMDAAMSGSETLRGVQLLLSSHLAARLGHQSPIAYAV